MSPMDPKDPNYRSLKNQIRADSQELNCNPRYFQVMEHVQRPQHHHHSNPFRDKDEAEEVEDKIETIIDHYI